MQKETDSLLEEIRKYEADLNELHYETTVAMQEMHDLGEKEVKRDAHKHKHTLSTLSTQTYIHTYTPRATCGKSTATYA